MALLMADAVLSVYANATGDGVPVRFCLYSLGILAGWISFATGLLALFALRKHAWAAGLYFIHGFINAIALLVLSAFWTYEYKTHPALFVPELPEVLLKWLMLFMLLIGVYVGRKTKAKRKTRKA